MSNCCVRRVRHRYSARRRLPDQLHEGCSRRTQTVKALLSESALRRLQPALSSVPDQGCIVSTSTTQAIIS
jgi:hypothetical protein